MFKQVFCNWLCVLRVCRYGCVHACMPSGKLVLLGGTAWIEVSARNPKIYLQIIICLVLALAILMKNPMGRCGGPSKNEKHMFMVGTLFEKKRGGEDDVCFSGDLYFQARDENNQFLCFKLPLAGKVMDLPSLWCLLTLLMLEMMVQTVQ